MMAMMLVCQGLSVTVSSSDELNTVVSMLLHDERTEGTFEQLLLVKIYEMSKLSRSMDK